MKKEKTARLRVDEEYPRNFFFSLSAMATLKTGKRMHEDIVSNRNRIFLRAYYRTSSTCLVNVVSRVHEMIYEDNVPVFLMIIKRLNPFNN